jgi:hypothetical protein
MANSKNKPSSGAPKFDEPVDEDALEQAATSSSSDFLVPPGEDGSGSDGDDSFDADHDAAASFGADNDVLQLKADLERQIFARSATQASAMSDGPSSSSMIVGVGIGAAHRDFESIGSAGPGAPVLNVYVSEPMDMDQVKGLLVDNFGASALSDDSQKVNVIVSGIIDAQPHRHRQRPAPCGISTAHFRVTAGTLGALAPAVVAAFVSIGCSRCRTTMCTRIATLLRSVTTFCNLAPLMVALIPLTGSPCSNAGCPSTLGAA